MYIHTHTHTHIYPYVMNTQSEEKNTVFYSYVASFVNTCTLIMYVSMPYYRVQQAEYSLRILVAAPQEYVNTYSTGRVASARR